ncbi:MAG: RHS repeat-associated core domain-containing protein [Thermoanaerobaculia bacterium]|nr:RHS repeat-associated core domain-containing protein [Thermoanaerobaculia bacterium]
MAANRRSTWRLLAALMLLVTVPAAGSIPALPPAAPKADLVSADLLDEVAGLEHPEILVLVAFVVPEETAAEGYPHPKTRVWASKLHGEMQPQVDQWFKGEIAVGVLVVRFYHADGLGSVRALTDEAGSVTDRWSFTAFGELLEHVGDDENAYLFAGEPLDPNSGFYYNRARWMDPGVGRFVSVDPWMGDALDPESLHRYLYASSSPTMNIDPTGAFSSTIDFGLASAIDVSNRTIATVSAIGILAFMTMTLFDVASIQLTQETTLDRWLGQGHWSPDLQKLKDSGEIASAYFIAKQLLRAFRELQKQGSSWRDMHEIEIWLPSGRSTKSVTEVYSNRIGRNTIRVMKGGKSGRVFQLDYSFGGARSGPNYFEFRMDYWDVREPPPGGRFNPHCHVGWEPFFDSSRHRRCDNVLRDAPGPPS